MVCKTIKVTSSVNGVKNSEGYEQKISVLDKKKEKPAEEKVAGRMPARARKEIRV